MNLLHVFSFLFFMFVECIFWVKFPVEKCFVKRQKKKMVQMILFAKQKQRHRHREQTYGYQGVRRWGGDDWEIGIDMYTLLMLCIKQITNESLLYSTGNSTQCSAVTEVGRKSKKERVYVYVQLIHFAVQQKLTQHCKAIILQ